MASSQPLARDLIGRFDGLIDDGLITGWVGWASGPSGRWQAASGVDGVGQVVDIDSQFHVYCAMKPLLATALGVLVDRGEVSFEDRLEHIIDVGSWLGSSTVADVLAHRSGVHTPSAIETLLLAGHERLAAALAAPPRPAADSAASHYTEAASWLVLEAVVETVAGTDAGQFVRSEVLDPLGIAEEFDLRCDGPAPRLRVNVAIGDGPARPLLIERTPALAWSTNPGFGGRASMLGLAALASDVGASVSGGGIVLSPATAAVMTRSGDRRYDDVLARECGFGLGWMTDLASHFFPCASVEAFGHVGLVGMTAMWADPAPGVAGAYHLNGWSDAETVSQWARPTLVRAMYTVVA